MYMKCEQRKKKRCSNNVRSAWHMFGHCVAMRIHSSHTLSHQSSFSFIHSFHFSHIIDLTVNRFCALIACPVVAVVVVVHFPFVRRDMGRACSVCDSCCTRSAVPIGDIFNYPLPCPRQIAFAVTVLHAIVTATTATGCSTMNHSLLR